VQHEPRGGAYMAAEVTDSALRTRHALRCTVGAVVLAVLAHTPATSGCLSFIFFLLATIASTPEPYLGFQARAAFYAFTGVLLAALSGLAILQAVALSRVGAFFLALPFVACFSLLRTDKTLTPLPVVASAFTGYFVISEIQYTRSQILTDAALLVRDAALASAIALAVNLAFPDLAGNRGRAAIAIQLRNTGAALSVAASRILSGVSKKRAPGGPVVEDSGGGNDCTLHAPRIMVSEVPAWPAAPARVEGRPSSSAFVSPRAGEIRIELEGSLRQRLTPRIASSDVYSAITRAEQLLAVSSYEPGLSCPFLMFRRKNLDQWKQLVEATRALVTKVSSLESVAHLPNSPNARFSRHVIEDLLGHAYVPLWVTHFAASAAACCAASEQVNLSTFGSAKPLPHDDLDTSSPSWLARRGQMYYGFLLQYRLYWRKRGLSADWIANILHTSVPCMGPDTELNFHGHERSRVPAKPVRSFGSKARPSEIQAFIFMAVSSHAVSEALSRVQSIIAEIEQTEKMRSPMEPLKIFNDALHPLARRISAISRGDLRPWEVRFAIAHSMMLSSILAISLLVSALSRFGAAQIAWVFVSAALVAQVRAEPTAFIATLRLTATVAGSFFGFGISTAMHSLPRRDLIFVVPVLMGILTFSTLLIISPQYRYAAFLFLATFALVLFCPRASRGCSGAYQVVPEGCRASLRFTLSRSICVSIGIVFALFFHFLFWPKYAQVDARVALSTVFVNSSRLFSLVHRAYLEHGQCSEKAAGKVANSAVSDDLVRGRMSILDEHRVLLSTVSEEDVMGQCSKLYDMATDLVGRHLSTALEATADAQIWPWSGPLAMPPLLRKLPEMFVTLSVALLEMTSILGRRPILSGQATYGQSAHLVYVNPLLFEYETMLVSLHSMVAFAERCIAMKTDQSSVDDLRSAVLHLCKTLRRLQDGTSSQRHNLHTGWRALHRPRADKLRRLHHDPAVLIRGDSACSLSGVVDLRRQRHRKLRRSHSMDVRTLGEDPFLPALDDIVLYNAFQYASDACVLSFIEIADAIIDDLNVAANLKSEAKLE
jgi:hypothetical protein